MSARFGRRSRDAFSSLDDRLLHRIRAMNAMKFVIEACNEIVSNRFVTQRKTRCGSGYGERSGACRGVGAIISVEYQCKKSVGVPSQRPAPERGTRQMDGNFAKKQQHQEVIFLTHHICRLPRQETASKPTAQWGIPLQLAQKFCKKTPRSLGKGEGHCYWGVLNSHHICRLSR